MAAEKQDIPTAFSKITDLYEQVKQLGQTVSATAGESADAADALAASQSKSKLWLYAALALAAVAIGLSLFKKT